MKYPFQIALVCLLIAMTALMSASAYALNSPGGHPRTQTYHDRTPRAHVHGSHPHR